MKIALRLGIMEPILKARDVIGLIDQISSKEVEEGQETRKTGRFGTGFLTTHLLSRVIKIKGIVGLGRWKFPQI